MINSNPQIIGVSGKIGSGKDTVGKVIQYLSSEAYKKRERSFELFQRGHTNLDAFGTYYYSPWEIKKFAGKLKEVASLLTGIPVNDFEDQDFKKTDLPEEWSTWYPNLDRPEPMTVRTLLQKVGTDCMRDCLHKNTWVNALLADFRPRKLSQYEPSQWIITDVRFPNEALAIKDKGGVLLRIERDSDIQSNHESETALDNWTFDYVIENNGTIEDLIAEVKFRFPNL
jgi:hypothetical protein